MSRIFKVLQIQPEYNVKPSDISDLAEQIVKALPTDQYEVTSAYIYGQPDINQPSSIAYRTKYFNFNKSDLGGLRLKVLWSLYKFCAENSFDVIICNRFKIVSLMLILNKLIKAPLCIGISHVMDEYRRPYRRLQIKYLADSRWRFVGVSDAVKDFLIDYNTGFTQKNTYAITNAIDVKQAEEIQLNKYEARQLLGLPQDKVLIGAIGQLIPRKGHSYLISALANIKNRFPNAHIGIIGRGPEEENLKKQITDLGLEGRVHLLGFWSDALQYVRAFDIWTMPSLSEGLGLALLEGMSGHLPIIATNIPAMLPLIKGAGGIAVPPKDTKKLTHALESYLKMNDEELSLKGEYAYQYLSKNHDIESYRENYLNLIKDKFK